MPAAYVVGVTTVKDRLETTLPKTLESITNAGFPKPRLFVDGAYEHDLSESYDNHEATCRFPRIRTYGNWMLSLAELYLRHPDAYRFVIFQDDILLSLNLRDYLDKCPDPHQGYWNLILYPENESETKGWHVSTQKGLGAQGLVLTNKAVRVLLQQQSIVDRPTDLKRGHKSIDGGIVTGFNNAGWKEYIHNPSLIYHQEGVPSSMGNKKQPRASTFRGESFDARRLFDEIKPLVNVENGPSKASAKVDRPKVPVIAPKASTRRIGIVGYNCRSGLGELNRQFAEYGDADQWLVQPHGKFQTLESHENVDMTVCPTGVKIDEWLKTVDTVLFAERPYYDQLIPKAKAAGKRIVCVPMLEWMPSGAKGWPEGVDLFICPTKQCYDTFAHVVPCVYFPWPVDTQRFKFQQRTTCEKFLYLHGHGGFSGRKGGNLIKEAKQAWPELPLQVRSQNHEAWPSEVEFLPEAENNNDIYSTGDVLIAPHSVDGIGLEFLEAAACGMPVISTKGEPWNEYPALARLLSSQEKKRVNRPVDWYSPHLEDLLLYTKAWLGKNIEKQSLEAREWAESRSWEKKAEEFQKLVRGAN